MIKNIFRLLIAVVFLFVAGSAGAETSVWVIKGPKSTLYLAGSCHVLRAADHPLPSEFSKAYLNSKIIIFEAPQDEMAGPEFQEKMMQVSIYNDGTTLRQHLSAKAYGKAEAFCKKRGYPLEQFQIFRPWMFAMTMTMMEMQRLGALSNYGVDFTFNEKAHQDGKDMGSLETIDEQIGFMTLLNMGTDDEQIIQSIDELEQIDARLTDIINAWKKGNEAGIEDLLLRGLKDFPKLYQALIINRNNKWLKKIEGYLNRPETVMVIVGAAHLVGNKGIIELLKKRGYKVVKF